MQCPRELFVIVALAGRCECESDCWWLDLHAESQRQPSERPQQRHLLASSRVSAFEFVTTLCSCDPVAFFSHLIEDVKSLQLAFMILFRNALDRPVLLLQDGGDISNSNAVVSYAQCAKGTAESPSDQLLCVNCTAGSFGLQRLRLFG